MKKKLALFDLDGTLFDTGEVNYWAYKEALSTYGIELEKAYFISECNGRHYTEFLSELMRTSENIEKVHKDKKIKYAANLHRARINTHVFELIKLMKADYYIALVTTASRKNTLDILEYFECQDMFEYIVTQEDVTKVKPNPQGFNLAMEHFGILAQNTVIFEDSEVGIQAARSTGATVMVVDQF